MNTSHGYRPIAHNRFFGARRSTRVLVAVVAALAGMSGGLGSRWARVSAQVPVDLPSVWQFDSVAHVPLSEPGGCGLGVGVRGLEFDPSNTPVVGWQENNGCTFPGATFKWARKDAPNGNPSPWSAHKIRFGATVDGDRRFRGSLGLTMDALGTPFYFATDFIPGSESLGTVVIDINRNPNGPGLIMEGLGPYFSSCFYSPSFVPRFGSSGPGWLTIHGCNLKLNGADLIEGGGWPAGADYAIGPSGQQHVLYAHGGYVCYNPGARVPFQCVPPGSGAAPTAETYVATINRFSGDVQIAADANNVLHAVIRGYDSHADWDLGLTGYVTSTDGGQTWSEPEFFDTTRAAVNMSLALDRDGDPAVAYWRYGELRFAYRQGGVWRNVAVTNLFYNDDVAGERQLRLSFDRNGAPSIAFFDWCSRDVRVATPASPDMPVDLAVTMTSAPNPAALGEPVTYTIDVMNHSARHAPGVVLTFTLPEGAAFVSAAAVPIPGRSTPTLTATRSGNVVSIELGTITSGCAANQVQVTVVFSRLGTQSATANVDSSVQDGDAANNSVSAVSTARAADCFPTVRWWPADGGAPVNYSGTLINTSRVPGKIGQAFKFAPDVHPYVEVRDNPAFDPAGSFAVTAWINTAWSGRQTIAAKYECGFECPSSALSDYEVYVQGGLVSGFVRDSAGTSAAVEGTTSVADGAYHHVALVRDLAAFELQLYLDGVLNARTSLAEGGAGTLGNDDGKPDPLTIGAVIFGWSPGYAFAGLIDGVSFYNRAPAPAEIADLYQNPILVPSDGACNADADGDGVPDAIDMCANTPAGTPVGSGGCPVACTPPRLQAWWPGDHDAADNVAALNGALQNGVGFAPGVARAAFDLDGRDDFVAVQDDPRLRPQHLTIAAWAKPATLGYVNTIASHGANNEGFGAYWIGVVTGYPRLGIQTGSSGFKWLAGPSPISPGTWYHIAGSYDGTTMKLYVDGALVATTAAPGPIVYDPVPRPFLIGEAWSTQPFGNKFAGLVDEVALFDEPLDEEQIRSLVANGMSSLCPVNHPPVVTNPGDRMNVEGDTVSLQVVASDPDRDRLTYRAFGLPNGLSIDPATGVIAGTIGSGGRGRRTIIVYASDGQAEDSQLFTWTVGSSAHVDLAVGQSASTSAVPAGTTLTYHVTLENRRPGNATMWTLTDELPAGVAFVGMRSNAGACELRNGSVVCWSDILNANATVAIDITVVPLTAGTITNRVTVTGVEIDDDVANNTSALETTVTPAATDRTALLVVNTIYDLPDADPTDGICAFDPALAGFETDLRCSLRAAVETANRRPGTTIVFSLGPFYDQPITLLSDLPAIAADGTIIDGTSLSWPVTIVPEPSDLRALDIAASHCVVRRLAFTANFAGSANRFATGILAETTAHETVIEGVFIVSVDGDGVRVEGVGTRIQSSAMWQNGTGIAITGTDTLVGGLVPAGGRPGLADGVGLGPGNDIRLNRSGVTIDGPLATGNRVLGNEVTENGDGFSTSGGVLLLNGAHDNAIGGMATGAGNRITANWTGVLVENGIGNAVLDNIIFDNYGIGIDLNPAGVTVNDAGDADTGANNLQNFPELNRVYAIGNDTLVVGKLRSEAGRAYRLEFFGSPSCDPSGFGPASDPYRIGNNPGDPTFLGALNVTTDATGVADFQAALALMLVQHDGRVITATATDLETSDTSEFSRCASAQFSSASDLEIAMSATPTSIMTGEQVTYTITATNTGPDTAPTIEITDTLPLQTTLVAAYPESNCHGTEVVTCIFGPLDAGNSRSLTIVVQAPSMGGTMVNSATVEGTGDPYRGNNTVTSETVVANTPTGTNINVRPADAATGATPVSITFSTVNQAGVTTVGVTGTGPNPPSGFSVGNPPVFYEVSTTAVFSDPALVCVNYDPHAFVNEADLRVHHFVNGTWIDETISLDVIAHVVCARVTSFSPFAVFERRDTTPPAIVLTSPSHTIYPLHARVASSYTCTDGGSGVASCAGTVANGALIDTASVGAKAFGVSASDTAGNTSATSVSYEVSYRICPSDDHSKVAKSGSTIPIKLRLCDAAGVNVSAPTVTVTALNIVRGSTGTAGAIVAHGHANPDGNFRYDAGLAGYMFNLKTTGLAPGTYRLEFTAGVDTIVHAVQFRIR